MIFLKLFYTFFKIGLFGFGGGYAMLSLIQSEVVKNHAWLTDSQFADIVAISQMTPGPIALNSATYIGYTVTGSAWGSAVATVAVSLPAFILMGLLTRLYLRYGNNKYVYSLIDGIKPVVTGMIAAAVLLMMTPENFGSVASYVIFGLALIASFMKVNPIYIIILSGVAGYFVF